jgi:hypothetical protein
MDLDLLNRQDLLQKCQEHNLEKYKSKTKSQLIELLKNINSSTCIKKPLKPLVKWSGGKGDEIEKFKHLIPTNYSTYLEPFIGGGSVYFHLTPEKAVISDVHKELIDFYQSIANGNAKDIYQFKVNGVNKTLYLKERSLR